MCNIRFDERMGILNRVGDMLMKDRSKLRKKGMEEHERLSRLFLEDRLAFEVERKRRIERAINRSRSKAGRIRLRSLQQEWDNVLKNAGSPHNRFILIQMLFWNQVRDVWSPALNNYERKLRRTFNTHRLHGSRPTLRRIE